MSSQLISAKIVSLQTRPVAVAPNVCILELELTDSYSFLAGQYLEIVHPSGIRVPLSISSTPEQLPRLTLHYRSTPDSPEAACVDELLATEQILSLGPAAGDVHLSLPDGRPLLMIAGGTGIAQALSLVCAQIDLNPGAPTLLLCCADNEDDFYFRDLIPESPALTSILLADPDRTESNAGLQWIRSHGVEFLQRHNNARTCLSGSPGFVYAATDALAAQGVAADRLQSDVFAYAPRSIRSD